MVSRALQIVMLCCCVVGQAGCYSPEITACQVTCAEAGGDCPEGTACTGGFCVPPGVEASSCRAGGAAADGGAFGDPSGMVMIPNDGSFLMGCVDGDGDCDPDESPPHSVTLSPYFIDVAEVTAKEYEVCVESLGCSEPAGTLFYQPGIAPNWPVTGMNRASAETYCLSLDKRLPTEAEWEKAARGTIANNIYSWGNEAPDCDRAQFLGCALTPATVKSFATTGSGLYDMTGNVWEWVSDLNGSYPAESVTDPKGPATGGTGILRGGGWQTGVGFMRVSNRNPEEITERRSTYGMRCAMDVP